MDGITKAQWEYIYQSVPTNQIPWEAGEPSPELVELFEEESIRKGMKVLDVGCGLGTQTRFMARKGTQAVGIDISETAIRKARERLLKDDIEKSEGVANFVIGDVCSMLFPNASFEVVYDRGCYHHLGSKKRRDYAHEVGRVLNPKGLLSMLVFKDAIMPYEVIEYFLPSFKVSKAYEGEVLDRTNSNQEIPIYIIRFNKL